eukprot:2208216-Rhodomonas_salina.1
MGFTPKTACVSTGDRMARAHVDTCIDFSNVANSSSSSPNLRTVAAESNASKARLLFGRQMPLELSHLLLARRRPTTQRRSSATKLTFAMPAMLLDQRKKHVNLRHRSAEMCDGKKKSASAWMWDRWNEELTARCLQPHAVSHGTPNRLYPSQDPELLDPLLRDPNFLFKPIFLD